VGKDQPGRGHEAAKILGETEEERLPQSPETNSRVEKGLPGGFGFKGLWIIAHPRCIDQGRMRFGRTRGRPTESAFEAASEGKTRFAREDVLRRFPFADEESTVSGVFRFQATIEPLDQERPIRKVESAISCPFETKRAGHALRATKSSIAKQKKVKTRSQHRFLKGKQISSERQEEFRTFRNRQVGTDEKDQRRASERQQSIMELVERLSQDPVVLSFLPEDQKQPEFSVCQESLEEDEYDFQAAESEIEASDLEMEDI